MSYDTKQLAEKLMQLHNSKQVLEDIISVLESSENTVKEDILKLVDGAKLEPQFDLNKLVKGADDLVQEIGSIDDAISSAQSCIEDASSYSCEASDIAYSLRDQLEAVKHKLIQDDESETEGE